MAEIKIGGLTEAQIVNRQMQCVLLGRFAEMGFPVRQFCDAQCTWIEVPEGVKDTCPEGIKGGAVADQNIREVYIDEKAKAEEGEVSIFNRGAIKEVDPKKIRWKPGEAEKIYNEVNDSINAQESRKGIVYTARQLFGLSSR